jgi:hypothetical protein
MLMMKTSDLVTAYTLTNPVEARLIENALRAEGIHCFLDGINQAAVPGIGAFEIKVQVPAADGDRASRLIRLHEERHTRMTS